MILIALSLLVRADDGVAPPVVGGEQAEEGKWDDAAAIYFGGQVGCTGVLVAPDVVLTAGHCTGGITKVKLGVNDYRDDGEVIEVDLQRAYQNSQSTYDIGVLVLEEDATVEPRTIAQGCILDEYLYDGAPVAIVGYGAINEQGTQYTTKLMEAYTTVTDADCSDLSSGCNGSVSPGGELGAGGSGVDACYGDSGGPLYLVTERGDYLVGTTSRAYDNVRVPCRDGGIYVRPDAVIDWIEEVSGAEIPMSTCNAPPEPSADTLRVRAGRRGEVAIDPGDADVGDGHTFQILALPSKGEATVAPDGVVTYEANEGAHGDDSLIVVVTDDGNPPMSGTVEVEVLIRKGGGKGDCGCAAGSSPAAGGLAALLALAGRRRRR